MLNHVVDRGVERGRSAYGDVPVDGIVEVWFANVAALGAALPRPTAGNGIGTPPGSRTNSRRLSSRFMRSSDGSAQCPDSITREYQEEGALGRSQRPWRALDRAARPRRVCECRLDAVCDPLLPRLAETFQATTADAAYAISAFGLPMASSNSIRTARRPLRQTPDDRAGHGGCTLGSVGVAIAPSLGWLVAFRVLSGGTAAAIIPLSWHGSVTLSRTIDAKRHWHGC